jgi:hypothetical protein
VTATDKAGNQTPRSIGYTVVYAFSGFFSPVDNPPALNGFKAGNTAPVKFSLAGNQGSAIFAAGSPSVQQINCTTHAPIGSAAATSGSLAYDKKSDRYTYTWQTSKTWLGSCQQLTVTL